MTDDRYLEHSKGPWKKHKYIRKDGKRYIYNNSSKGNIRGKSVKSSYDKEKTFWDEIDKNYIERLGRSPKQLLNSQDFAITLEEFGGYDTDSMSPKEIERLKKRFKKRYNIHDNDFNGMPSDVAERMRHSSDDYGYLVHSKGPWKKHKYLSKVGNKYVYAKNQIVNGIHGFGARLRKKVRKKVGLEARDEFMKRAVAEEMAISNRAKAIRARNDFERDSSLGSTGWKDYTTNPLSKNYRTPEHTVHNYKEADAAVKGADIQARELHKKTNHAYDKYRKTVAGKAEKALGKVLGVKGDYATMDYWEPAKTSLNSTKKKKKKK